MSDLETAEMVEYWLPYRKYVDMPLEVMSHELSHQCPACKRSRVKEYCVVRWPSTYVAPLRSRNMHFCSRGSLLLVVHESSLIVSQRSYGHRKVNRHLPARRNLAISHTCDRALLSGVPSVATAYGCGRNAPRALPARHEREERSNFTAQRWVASAICRIEYRI